MKETISFCPTCYRRIPAVVYVEDGKVWMRKTCTAHGQTTAMVERDAQFYERCAAAAAPMFYTGYLQDVTSRCNLSCKYCYRGQDAAADPSIQHLCQDAYLMRYAAPLIVTGGEPTLRGDLPSVMSALKSVIPDLALLTNGTRLDDALLDDLLPLLSYSDAPVRINLSMHPESGGADYAVLERLRERGLKAESVLVVIDDLEQIHGVVDLCERYGDTFAVVRIKAATRLWAEDKPDPGPGARIFTSDMLDYCMREVPGAAPMWWANNKVSFFNLQLGAVHAMLVSWYDVTNVDLLDIACPPYYTARTGSMENLVAAAIVNEGMSKGWLNGHRYLET